MKVALIWPPGVFGLSEFSSALVPPLGLLYLAAALIEQQHSVTLIDAQAVAPYQFNPTGTSKNTFYRGLTPQQIVQHIAPDTQVIGVSFPYSAITEGIKFLVDELRQSFPNSLIITGGAHASALPEQVLTHPGIDAVIMGEAEHIFPRVLERVSEGVALEEIAKEIPHFVCRESISAHALPVPAIVEDVDSLPLPARDLIPMEQYITAAQPHGTPRGRWTTLIASRGCPYHCRFCTTPRLSQRHWRIRSVVSVISEMTLLHKKYQITDFHFEDDNNTINHRWLANFCDSLEESKLPFTWQINVGAAPRNLTDSLIQRMKKCGLTNITFAPESGSSRVLKEILDKNDFRSEIERCTKAAVQADVRVCQFFIMGAPGETVKEIRQSISFARKLARLGADEVSMALFTPLPGSRLFDEMFDHKSPWAWEDPFFTMIQSQSNWLRATSWSPTVSSFHLGLLRLWGMLTFYLHSFFWHPGKLFRLIKNVFSKNYETKTARILGGKLDFLFPTKR